jgi:hypothetical protein
MDKTDFLAVMDLALTDLRVVEPETIGIVMLALHKTADGTLHAQFGSNVDHGLVAEALYSLMDGDLRAHRHKRKIT